MLKDLLGGETPDAGPAKGVEDDCVPARLPSGLEAIACPAGAVLTTGPVDASVP